MALSSIGVTIHVIDGGESWIKSIKYEVRQGAALGSETFLNGSLGFVAASNDFYYCVPVSWNKLYQGISTISITVEDNAGNISLAKSITFKKDISSANVNISEGPIVYYNKAFYDKDNQSTPIKVSFIDGYPGSGIKDILLWVSHNIIQNEIELFRNGITYNYKPWNIAWVSLNNGYTEVFVTVNDNAGNQTNKYLFKVLKDAEVPQIHNNETRARGWYSNVNTSSWLSEVMVTFDDVGSSNIHRIEYGVSINNSIKWYTITDCENISQNFSVNGRFDKYYQSWPISWNVLTNGVNEIYVSINDFAFNSTSSYILRISKDLISPNLINNEALLPNTQKFDLWYSVNTPNGMSTFNVIIFDKGGSGLASISYQINGKGWDYLTSDARGTTTFDNWSIAWQEIDNGTNDIQVSFNDYALNRYNEKVFTIYKDTINPSISSNVISKDVYFYRFPARDGVPGRGDSSPSLNFAVTITDNGYSGINIVQYGVSSNKFTNGIRWVTDPTYSRVDIIQYVQLDWDQITDGENEIFISVNDLAGNTASTNRSIFTLRKDTSPPHINHSFAKGITYNAYFPLELRPLIVTPFVVTFSEEVGSSGLATINYGIKKVSEDPYGDYGIQWFLVSAFATEAVYSYTSDVAINYNALGEGTNEIYFYVLDMAGFSTLELSYFINKDTQVPQREITELMPLEFNVTLNRWYKDQPDWWTDLPIKIMDAGGSHISTISYKLITNNSGQINDIPWTLTPYNSSVDEFASINIAWSSLNIGSNEIWIQAEDHGFNILSFNAFTIKVDTQYPTGNYTRGYPFATYNLWYREDNPLLQGINFSFYDYSYSGLVSLNYVVTANNYRNTFNIWQNTEIPGSSWIWNGDYSYSSTWIVSWNVLTDDTNYISVIFKDYAGNETLSKNILYLKKDTLTPNMMINRELISDNSIDTWYNNFSPWMLNLTADVSDRGFSGIQYVKMYVTTFNSTANEEYIATQNISKNNIVGLGFNNPGLNLGKNYWDLLNNGTNNIAIEVGDNSGDFLRQVFNTASAYSFFIKKDMVSPNFEISGNWKISNAVEMQKWHRTSPTYNSSINIDFYDTGYSNFSTIQYVVSYNNNQFIRGITSNSIVYNKPSFTPNWTVDWSLLTSGVNEIYVSFNDRAGNLVVSGPVFQVLKDIISPNITNNMTGWTTTFNWWLRSSLIPSASWLTSIDIDFSDLGGSKLQMASYIVSQDSRKSRVTNNITGVSGNNSVIYNWSLDWSALDNGTNNIYVQAFDWADNSTFNFAFYVRKDEISPTFSKSVSQSAFDMWISSTDDFRNKIGASALTVTFNDIGSSNLACIYHGVSWNGSLLNNDWITDSSTLNHTSYTLQIPVSWSELANGTNEILLSGNDHAGNPLVGSEIPVLRIKKDNISPSFYLISPIASEWQEMWHRVSPDWLKEVVISFSDTGSSDINNINYSIVTAGTGVTRKWISIKVSHDSSLYNNAFYISWDYLSVGTNNVIVSFNDHAMNSICATAFYILKDDIPPGFTNLEPIHSSWYNAAPTSINHVSITITDNGYSGISNIFYKVSVDELSDCSLWQEVTSGVRLT
ncbi:MAG: hypothetical protein WCH76_04940, partial [Candidatus Riflemargulisbacteria bacterium]